MTVVDDGLDPLVARGSPVTVMTKQSLQDGLAGNGQLGREGWQKLFVTLASRTVAVFQTRYRFTPYWEVCCHPKCR